MVGIVTLIVALFLFLVVTRLATTALVLTLLRQVLVLIPLLIILPRFLGLDGVWAAAPISDFTSFLLTAVALTLQLRVLPRQSEPHALQVGEAEQPAS